MIFPHDPHGLSISRTCQFFTTLAGAVALLVGMFALAGWVMEVEWLKSLLPGYVSMKVNTGVALALSGAALLVRSLRWNASLRRRWTVALSGPVIALGVLTLAEYLSGLNLGIDHWSFHHPPLFGAVAFDPARMAPATAYCVMLIGAALVLSVLPQPMKWDWRLPTIAAFGTTMLTVGTLAVTGYLSRAAMGTPFLNKAGPAIHTALAFMLLGAALLALVRSEGGLAWALEGAVTTGFAIGVAVMLLAAGTSFSFTERLLNSATWVAHTQEVLKEIQEVKTLVADLESSQRGYIITGNEELLQARDKEKAGLAADLTAIGTLTADNVRQQRRLAPLKATIKQRLAFGDQTIVIRRQSGFAAAQDLIGSGAGILLSKQIGAALNVMEEEEDTLLGQRQIATGAATATTFLLLPVAVFLSMTTLSAGLFFLNAGLCERARTEANLHTSDERLRIVTENARVGLVMVDRQRRYTFANAAYSEIFRFPATSLIGLRVEDVQPALYFAQIRERLDRAFAGERVTFEMHDAVPGQDRHYSVRYEPTKVDGEVRFVVAVFMDVTERKEAEAARILLAAIIDSSHDAIVGKDLNSVVTSWNAGAERMFGYSAQEMVGQSILALVPPDRQSEEEMILARVRSGQVVDHFETVRLTKSGAELSVSVTVSPIKDAGGKVIGASKIARDITEHRQAEEALRSGEECMRLATEATGVGIWQWHISTHEVSWDAQMFRIYGIAPTANGRLPYETWRQCVLPEDLKAQEDQQRETIRIRGRASLEFRVRRVNDGEVRHIQAVATVRVNALGEAESLVGTNLDITVRKQAEAAVQESERRFRSMVDAIPQLAWIARADGFIFWYNRRWYEYTGAQPGQMEGWGWEKVHDPKVLPEVMTQWSAAIATEQAFEMEFPLRGADTTYRRFLTRAVPLKDAEGHVLQWFGTNTDVDELKRVEDSLRHSEATLIDAQTQACIGNWEVDLETEAITWSAQMFHVLGRDPALGSPSLAQAIGAIHPEDREVVRRNFADAIASRQNFAQDSRTVRPDGSIRWHAARSRLICNDAGKPIRMVGTSQDITERKEAEIEVRRLNADLEQRVIKRTSQLASANSALETARVRAETADRAKSAFLASMSHELRTPLNGIIGFSEFLVDQKPGPLNTKQDEYLNDVLNSARHLLQLINDILDLAKVEAGKIDLRLERFSPRKVIEGVCAVIKSIALKKGIAVEWSVATDLTDVLLDQQKFKQICYNLLSNAVKFTDAGGSVTIRATSPANGQFALCVSDTGTGIRPEDLPRLFREFQQLGSAERCVGGTGLGLVLTKKLVEAQGGSIAVESEYGKGTTFRVFLPLEVTSNG
jgi:PAS domain S-box-containing protein